MITLRIILVIGLLSIQAAPPILATDISCDKTTHEHNAPTIDPVKKRTSVYFTQFVSEQSHNAYNAIKEYNFRQLPLLFVEYGGGAYIAHNLAKPISIQQFQPLSDFFSTHETTTSYIVALLEVLVIITLFKMGR